MNGTRRMGRILSPMNPFCSALSKSSYAITPRSGRWIVVALVGLGIAFSSFLKMKRPALWRAFAYGFMVPALRGQDLLGVLDPGAVDVDRVAVVRAAQGQNRGKRSRGSENPIRAAGECQHGPGRDNGLRRRVLDVRVRQVARRAGVNLAVERKNVEVRRFRHQH